MTSLRGKNVLVTGACGTIGSNLISEILQHEPGVVRAFDNSEEGMFALQESIGDTPRVRFLLGDIRDRSRLELAIENIDVVFHAAALKHIGLNEYNPFETIQTNVQGTQNLIRAAINEEVGSFVAVSTDKASNPTSVMGATKLLSERLVIAANTYKGDRETDFSCVRFGNVLESSGSVVPIFREQIRNGGPVTVTDPEMTRFVMPIEEAIQFILSAHELMACGEVFVSKMPSIRIGTLAEAMVEYFAPKAGISPDTVPIEIIGARPGERTHEKLISVDECSKAWELDDVFVLLPTIQFTDDRCERYTNADSVTEEYTSADGALLKKTEIIDLIESNVDHTDPDRRTGSKADRRYSDTFTEPTDRKSQ